MSVDPDTQRGLYRKYQVRKIKQEPDQRGEMVDVLVDPGECFVLNHKDPHAVPALRAYAESCAAQFQSLATDLAEMAGRWASELLPGIEIPRCSLCHRERTMHGMDAYDYNPAQVLTGQPVGWYSGDDGEVCPECMTQTIGRQ